ncbi:MAG: DUF4421 domain-containing protein [Bacteroidetes bacterium]|nr:DUF4421 domain-containing protein [Bacteroidota bacterium]
MNRYILLTISFFLVYFSTSAQTKKNWDHDSTYYVSYRDMLTARAYLSRKYTSLKFKPPSGNLIPEMKYLPNTTLNVGVGGTYRSLTVNIGVGISRFNPDNKRGRTKYLDLQSHWYARKWNIDLLGQFYRGYYLSPKGLGSPDGSSYYVRHDLRVQIGGIAAYRALNGRQFSYQAGLLQNEWQKKSAGSIIVGAEAYYGSIHGDSTFVPKDVDPGYAQLGISKIHFLEIGPGIGYAYTLIIAQHFFLLGSATLNVDFNYTLEKTINRDAEKIHISPNFIFRAGAGYNTDKWDLSVLWVSTYLHMRGDASDYRYRISSGNYRLIYARRFHINHKVKKVLQPINDLIEQSQP